MTEQTTLINELIDNFVTFGHSKSGGHGGQKVNKKETKAELFFDINNCNLITEEQKDALHRIYHNWINHEGILHMSSHEERLLHSNKKKVIHHFHDLMTNILQGNPHHLWGYHKHHHHKH